MKSKELLFELIKSLSKSEKRYFKVFTSVHKESNNYVKLFNAIHDQNEYDEDALIEQFKNEDFIRQFSVAKNYLMNLILKSLSNHHQKAKKSMELNEYLTEIEVLYWKGLYKLAHKRINQAKKIASSYNMLHYLLLINYWERRIEDYISKTIINEDVVEETQVLLDSYNQQMQMNFLIKKMQTITKLSIKSTKQSLRPVQEIFNHKLMRLNEDEIDNFYTKVDYLLLKGIGNSLLGDGEKEFYYKKRLLDFLEENPHQIKENPLRYASSLNNILLYYYFQGYPEEYPMYLEKLDNIELKFSHAKASFYDTKYNLKIGYYLHLRDKQEVSGVLEEMEGHYKNGIIKNSVQAKMIWEYNMALAHFFLKNTKQCLYWCNSCFVRFDMKTKKYRHDLAISTLIVQTFIYFELNHFDLAVKNMELIFSIAKANKYGAAEMAIFKIMREMIYAETTAGFIEKIDAIIKKQATAFINLDKDAVVFWLESKGY